MGALQGDRSLMAIFHKMGITNFFGALHNKVGFWSKLQFPTFIYMVKFISTKIGPFLCFFSFRFSFEAWFSFFYDSILIKLGQNVDIHEVNNSY